MRITHNNHIWKIVNDKAIEIYKSGLFELYYINDEDEDFLIKTFSDLEYAKENNFDICIEVGCKF